MGWDDAAWDGLLADLYAAAIDQDAAARLPDRFSALTGGAVASLWRLRPHDLAILGRPETNIPAEAVAAYQDHYHQHDPWGGAVRHARYNAVLRGSELVDDDTLARSTYYNEFSARFGGFHMLGALVPLGASAKVGVISILRPKHAEAFDAQAAAALGRALPHIQAAFRLREQLEAAVATVQAEALDAALDAFGIPAAVLDGHGTVLRINPPAEAVACLRHAATRRNNPHRVLRLPVAPGHERWHELLAAAARGEAGGQFRLLDADRAYLALVTPLPPRLSALAGGAAGRVLLVLRPLNPPNRTAIAAEILALTQAESEVAAALADGLTPAEIAASRDVKISTVRTLLQRAQDKAGCRNLRDLVRLLASLN